MIYNREITGMALLPSNLFVSGLAGLPLSCYIIQKHVINTYVFFRSLSKLFVPIHFSEDASLIASLQDELKNVKEEMEQLKSTPVSLPSSLLHVSASKVAA